MHTIVSLAAEKFGTVIITAETKAFLSAMLEGRDEERMQRLVDTSRIERRQALGTYEDLRRLGLLEERNRLYMQHALPVAERAARKALEWAGLAAGDVDVLIVASSTGHSVPTLDQHLAAVLDLRADARRIFLGGLGCSGAVRAMNLAADLLSASPASKALVVSVELCSPWLQVAEPSSEDLLSDVLFGDGAAAMVVGHQGCANGPAVIASHSELWPQSLSARGATLTQTGFRHFASPTLPRILRRHLRPTVESFLARCGIGRGDLRFFAIAPSDHRTIETVAATLEIPDRLMEPTWAAWRQYGNTLSAGPLYVLDELRAAPPASGDLGLAVVLGPGVACDLSLLRWQQGLAS